MSTSGFVEGLGRIVAAQDTEALAGVLIELGRRGVLKVRVNPGSRVRARARARASERSR
jgi:hypothetical protein